LQWEDVNLDGGDFSITTNDYPHLADDACFVYSKAVQNAANFTSRGANNAYFHSGGCAIRGTCTNSYVTLSSVRSVQVDGGATLEVNGEGDVSFTSLAVDMAKGCGTIKGGRFAAEGTVRLESYPSGSSSRTIPFDLSETTGAENISRWGIEVGNEPRSRLRVRYANNALTIYPVGMRVIFR